MFFHSLAYFYQLSFKETNFKYQIFYFPVYVDFVEENILYQQLRKNFREKICRIKVFR